MDKLQQIFRENEDEIIKGLDEEEEIGYVALDVEEGYYELQVSYEKLAEWYGIEEHEVDVFEKSSNYHSIDGLDKVGVHMVSIAEQLEEKLSEADVRESLLKKLYDRDYSDLKLVVT